jgi:hypothetical protein
MHLLAVNFLSLDQISADQISADQISAYLLAFDEPAFLITHRGAGTLVLAARLIFVASKESARV